MMDKTIIGIYGLKRSGKDTAASYIRNVLEDEVGTMYWATGVKRAAAAALGLDPNYFFNDKSKGESFIVGDDSIMTGRHFLQKVGTECFRDNINTDFWVTRLLIDLEKRQEHIILIPDTRFPNEYDAIKKVGGYVIRVNRPQAEDGDRHASETALLGQTFDADIDNSGPYLGANFILDIHKFLGGIGLNIN